MKRLRFVELENETVPRDYHEKRPGIYIWYPEGGRGQIIDDEIRKRLAVLGYV